MPVGLLNNLRTYAQSQGIPLAQALRLASEEFTNKATVRKTIETVKSKKYTATNSLLAMAGMLKAGPTNLSSTVDEIYDPTA